MDGSDGNRLGPALAALDELLDRAELEIGTSQLRFEPAEGMLNRADAPPPTARAAALRPPVGMTNGGMLRRPEGLGPSHGLINGFGREGQRPRARAGRGLSLPALRSRRARRAQEALARMAKRPLPEADPGPPWPTP